MLTDRRSRWTRTCSINLCAFTTLLCSSIAFAQEKKSVQSVRLTFERDVVPILRSRCFKCHGEKVRKAGLDLRRKFLMVRGGDSGAAIVSGKPDASLLVEKIRKKQMPPEGETSLDKKQVAILVKWIASGAATQGKTELPLETTGVDAEISVADRQFWSFQPPKLPMVPTPSPSEEADRIRTPIDAFLSSKLAKAGGRFSDDAPKEILIRRLAFDLLSLPPTSDEIDAFLQDERPDAYEQLVDQMLASPRYGERWGRHWLDVAGYADSDGYLAADRLRPEAWRYRDYVIRALNSDKPYKQFVLEQMAGDELFDWRRAKELTPEMAESLTATGFLRTALDPTYGGYAEPLECYKVVADTMQIVSSAFIGLTIQCARCHAHKFDPISQRDYYQMHSIFLASYDPKRWQVSLSRAIPMATDSEQARIKQHNAEIDAKVNDLNAMTRELSESFDESLKTLLPKLTEDESTQSQIYDALTVKDKKRTQQQKKLIQRFKPHIAKHSDYFKLRDELKARIVTEQVKKQSIVQLRGLHDLDDKPAQAHLLIRGDYNTPGSKVEPGVPAVLTDAGFEFDIKPGYQTTGRRLALARWLTRPQNPLTARVHVNRIWAHHFGRGLVATLDNFGLAGSPPSHPELLDWLATEFIRSGWSQKHIHRLILTSTAWRQSAGSPAWQKSADPENRLLGSWRPLRHEGEVIRDSILALTGKLNREMYGPPVPVQRRSDGLVTVGDSPKDNRASVYVIVRRSQQVTLLEMFDTPLMEINCPERTESVVVTQSLTMLNSKFIESNARILAARTIASASHDAARLDLVYRQMFGRLPTDSERSSIEDFLKQATAEESSDQKTAHRRTWEQLCIVLLNSNEFIYVH